MFIYTTRQSCFIVSDFLSPTMCFWFKTEKFPKASGIIYCCSKKDAEKLANTLTIKHSINSAFYHGSMEDKDKNSIQHMWTTNDIQVICATVGNKTQKIKWLGVWFLHLLTTMWFCFSIWDGDWQERCAICDTLLVLQINWKLLLRSWQSWKRWKVLSL